MNQRVPFGSFEPARAALGLLRNYVYRNQNMFATAVTLASEFTRPVLISTRQQSGKMETSCGTYILVNSDGWILTAGHVVRPLLKFREDRPKYEAYRVAREAVDADTTLPKG